MCVLLDLHLVLLCLPGKYGPGTKLMQRKKKEGSNNCNHSSFTDSVKGEKHTHKKTSILYTELLLNRVTLDNLDEK